jgi:hypothetical protein
VAVRRILVLVKAAPLYFSRAQQICTLDPAACTSESLMTAERLRQFEASGVSLAAWAGYTLVSRLFITAVFAIVALLIFLRKPHGWFPLFVAFFLISFGANNGVINLLGRSSAGWRLPAQFITAFAWVGFLLFFTLFPGVTSPLPGCSGWW